MTKDSPVHGIISKRMIHLQIAIPVMLVALALGGTAAGSLKLFYLPVFVWFLLESRKKISSKLLAAAA